MVTGRVRWALVAAVAVAAALLVRLLAPTTEIDLAVYRMGAEAVVHGRADADLYALVSGAGHRFTYPPLAALIFTPLAAMSAAVARVVADVVSALALTALVGVSLAATGRRPGLPITVLLVLGSLVLEPVALDLRVGQISLLLVTAVVADLAGAVPRRFRGALTGLAAAIKLTPLAFLVFLALTRQWRALAVSAGTFAVATAAAFAALPHASRRYWTTYLFQTGRVGDPVNPDDQSLRGTLARLGLPEHGIGADAVWLGAVVLGAGAALALATLWWRRGERLLGLGLVGLASVLASPISWGHHWCWVVPLVIALSRLSWVAAAAAAVPFLVVRRIAYQPAWRHAAHHWTVVQQIVGNGYVWAALLLIGYAAWRLRRPSERDPWTPDPRGAPLT